MSGSTGADRAPVPAAAGDRSLWLDPAFGASGDMLLGALVGLGAGLDDLRRGLGALGVEGWSIRHEPVLRSSLSADRVVVTCDEQHHHRTWSSIDRLLEASGLPDPVRAGARATFRRLGEVEAAIHRVDIDQVHFHEVGALDAIVDIVGSWLALDLLGVLDGGTVTCGPVGLAGGTVTAAHGPLPLPAPATAALLAGAPIRPVGVPLDVDVAIVGETVTPTGAALLATMADRWGPMPAGVLLASARGAGGRDPKTHPNVLSAHLIATEAERAGPTGASPGSGAGGEPEAAVELCTNLDDVTPEVIAHVIDRCLRAGADDAWATPIVMKKGRPAIQLSALCPPAAAERVRLTLFRETGSLGVRSRAVTKHVLPRRFRSVTVRGQEIAIKVGPHGAKPEFDDLVRAADALQLPLRQVAIEAIAAHDGSATAHADRDRSGRGISERAPHGPNS